jgi:enolase
MLLESIITAMKKPVTNRTDVMIGLDCASSEFYENGILITPNLKEQMAPNVLLKNRLNTSQNWSAKYPIDSIEDGMSENDWEGWKLLTKNWGKQGSLVGDDLFVTNVEFLKKGIEWVVPIPFLSR